MKCRHKRQKTEEQRSRKERVKQQGRNRGENAGMKIRNQENRKVKRGRGCTDKEENFKYNDDKTAYSSSSDGKKYVYVMKRLSLW